MKIEEKIFPKGYSLKSGDNLIELIKDDRRGYDFRRFKVSDSIDNKLMKRLKKRFYKFASEKNCIIQSEDSERDRKQSEFLTDSGLVITNSRHCFEKILSGHKHRYNDIFQYCSIKVTGLEKFYSTFRQSAKYPPRTYGNFVKATDKIIKNYNSGGTTDFWQTVYLKNKPVGILMPYKIYSTYPPMYNKKRAYGTLIYIGLIPEERGKGYGRIIHSKGLMIMKQMGLKYYLGSTDSKNKAMLHVFRANNCQLTMTQNFYKCS